MNVWAYISVYWGDEFGKPPKTPEERARDEALAMELLERAKQLPGVRIVRLRPRIPRLPGDQVMEEERPFYELKVKGRQTLETLLDLFQPAAHLISPFWIQHEYTPNELESAPLLVWGPTNQAIEDDYYDLEVDGYQGGEQASHRRCPACRTDLEQVRDLLVKTHKTGKRDLSLTYSYEVILSARLAQMLQQAGFTGFTPRPVWSYRKPYQGEPPLFQLVVTNVLPPMASPPTEFENPQHCDVCGRTSQYLKHTHRWGEIEYREDTPIYYPRRVLEEAQDFNRTAEYFGDLPDAHPYVIISQRVYWWLREQGIKGWAAEPVYLVE